MTKPIPKRFTDGEVHPIIEATEPCSHPEITLFGSEETGLRNAICAICGVPMTRVVVSGEYEYHPVPEEKP